MKKYNIGDRVLLSKDSIHYGRNEENPTNMIGIITSNNRLTKNNHCYVVEWSDPEGKDKTKIENNYREEDLILEQFKIISNNSFHHFEIGEDIKIIKKEQDLDNIFLVQSIEDPNKQFLVDKIDFE